MKSNQMKTKLPAVLLSVVMGGSLLAGCASSGDTPKDAGAGAKAESGQDNKPLTIKMFAGLYNEVPDMNNAYWTE